ncbi:hypothetical protein JTB14_027027 [Gonioctena quinquepunctata]|nr:hypothetical protein JTB14_027027 [Gonioctena quinquepunctata]
MHVSNRLSQIAAEGVQKRRDELIERCIEICERLENNRQERNIEEIPEAIIYQGWNISQHLLLEALSIHENGEQLDEEKHLLETPPRRVSFQASGLEHDEIVQIVGTRDLTRTGLRINMDIVPVGTMSSNIINFPGKVEVVGKVPEQKQQPGTSTRSRNETSTSMAKI